MKFFYKSTVNNIFRFAVQVTHDTKSRLFPFLSFLLLLLFLLLIACPEPPPGPPPKEDCSAGYLSCEDDSTECCPVVCAEGYHLGGVDSTECILDTTNHNVFWVADTLSGGYLYDAAIIDENNIWVVGYIETDSGTYNAARWDGVQWLLEKIKFRMNYEGKEYWSDQVSILSVFAIDNTVWFVTHGFVTTLYDTGWQYNKIEWGSGVPSDAIWGTSKTHLYFIGQSGGIVHYNGTTFTKMESRTDVELSSISGTDETNVWVSGYDSATLQTVLLHYDGNVWETVVDYVYNGVFNPNKISGVIEGVYTDDPDSVWVLTSNGLYRCASDTEGEGDWMGADSDPTSKIEVYGGTSHNDLFYSGHFNRTWHYNGQSTIQYQEIADDNVIYGMDMNKDMVVLAGIAVYSDHCIVYRGYR